MRGQSKVDHRLVFFTLVVVFTASVCHADEITFNRDIAPMLAAKCFACHGPDEEQREAGLRLDQEANAKSAKQSGATAIVAGNSEDSELLRRVMSDGDERMPPADAAEPLTPAEIDLLRKWIDDGAKWQRHWAFEMLDDSPPPIPGGIWCANPIDQFIAAKLEQHGLTPAMEADRYALIRRLYFGLTGLPPSTDAIQTYIDDQRANAYEQLVDSLLASPAYGERWGRHWLDVARYGDSNGGDENHAYPHAHRYRDYVIDAFNEDMTYDRFIQQQLAGDLLPKSDDDRLNMQRLTATGYLAIGMKILAEQDQVKKRADMVDEQIDTFGRTFLGLSLGCARCHDHKFDPIPTKDYYALAGIFHSSEVGDKPLETRDYLSRLEQHKQRVQSLESEVDALQERLNQSCSEGVFPLAAGKNTIRIQSKPMMSHIDKIRLIDREHVNVESLVQLDQLTKQLEQFQKEKPAPTLVMAIADDTVANTRVHVRGSHLELAEEVPRRFLDVLDGTTASIPDDQSGRLHLAQWLTKNEQAATLTSRVIVNRVWHWHFGRGLAATPDDFGIRGAPPTHPRLLDFLARWLIEHDWSLKSLHRLIVTSNTYRMHSNVEHANAEQVDPTNQLYWRRNRMRLDAESIRDALLFHTGQLAPQIGDAPMDVKSQDPSPQDMAANLEKYERSRRRSVYLPVVRSNVYEFFTLFDFPNASTPVGKRNETTIPTQALWLMNSPFIVEHAKWVGGQQQDKVAAIKAIYLKLFCRRASQDEISRGIGFLEKYRSLAADEGEAWSAYCQVLLSSNDFLYLD